MKKNYSKSIIKSFISLLLLLSNGFLFAQNIQFTFANAQNTNDGSNDFYEVDVMIESDVAFKLGQGLLYFNYNPAAFGTNISGGSKLEITYPSAEGYICGQKDNVVGTIDVYGPFVQNDNAPSRFAFAFLQTFGSGSFANNVPSTTPTKLFHIKIEYFDVNEAPALTFEEGSAYDDQFSTACGPTTPLTAANCGTFPGITLVNDTFDSGGSTLGIDDELLTQSLRFYPNPVKDVLAINSEIPLTKVEIFSILGKKIKEINADFDAIPTASLSNGVYIIRLYSENGIASKKLIKQ